MLIQHLTMTTIYKISLEIEYEISLEIEDTGCGTYREWLPPVDEYTSIDKGEKDVVQQRLRCWCIDT